MAEWVYERNREEKMIDLMEAMEMEGIMSKETKTILDELNYSIGRINEKESQGKKLKESQYWYREGLKTARDIVLKIEKET